MDTTTPQPTPATVSAEQIEQAIHNLEAFRQPLNIVATANGHVTEGLLAGVFIEDLETVIATARAYHALREAVARFLAVGDGYDDDGDAYYAARARLDAALLPATEGQQP